MNRKFQTLVNLIVITFAIGWAVPRAVSVWSNRPHIATLSATRNESFEMENVSIITHVGDTALMRVGSTSSYLVVPNVVLNVGYWSEGHGTTFMIDGIPSQCHGLSGRMSYSFPHEEETEGNYILMYDIPADSEPTTPLFHKVNQICQ